jgi:hypothetical protein
MATAGTYKGVEIRSGSDADVAKQIAQVDSSLATSTPKTVQPITPITPTDLTGQATPAKYTPPATPTAGTGMQASLEADATSTQDQFTRDLTAQTDTYQKSTAGALADYIKNLTSSKGETEQTTELYAQKGGADDIRKELNDINQQILSEQHGLRRRIESIRENKSGLFGGAVEQEVGRVQDESLKRQADLSVIQMGVQGRYDSAKEIADRAVKVALERQQMKNQALQLNYEFNKELFTKSEQRQFETMQADRERKLNSEENNLKNVYNLAIDAQQNGAPTSLVQQAMKAKTAEEAMGLIGRYVGALDRNLKQAQLSKLNQELSTNGSINVSSIMGDTALPATTKNNAVLTYLLGSNKIGQGTRTQLANILGVINASGDIATARQDGIFKGVSPVNAVLDAKIPWTNIGIPFRNALRSKEGAENTGYIEAVNLKVQQWASGAALTTAQTEQVGRFTPTTNDTDALARTKLNNLVNFMLTQAKSNLQSEGIDYVPEKVNLFETYDMLQQLSPEQQKELQAQGLI